MQLSRSIWSPGMLLRGLTGPTAGNWLARGFRTQKVRVCVGIRYLRLHIFSRQCRPGVKDVRARLRNATVQERQGRSVIVWEAFSRRGTVLSGLWNTKVERLCAEILPSLSGVWRGMEKKSSLSSFVYSFSLICCYVAIRKRMIIPHKFQHVERTKYKPEKMMMS